MIALLIKIIIGMMIVGGILNVLAYAVGAARGVCEQLRCPLLVTWLATLAPVALLIYIYFVAHALAALGT